MLALPAEAAPAAARADPQVDAMLEVHDVVFGYQAERPVLHGVRLVVAPGEAMFGTEQGNKMHTRGMSQEINRASALRVHARVIRDHTNVLAAQRSELLRFKNIESGLHTARAA